LQEILSEVVEQTENNVNGVDPGVNAVDGENRFRYVPGQCIKTSSKLLTL